MNNVTRPCINNSRNRNISPIIDRIQDYGPALLDDGYDGLIPVTPKKVIKEKLTTASSVQQKAAANDAGKSKSPIKSGVKITAILALALTLSAAIYTSFYLYTA